MKKYKTFGYIPKPMYTYYVYDKEGIYIDKFNSIPDIVKKFNLNENGIRVAFIKNKYEVKYKEFIIHREKNNEI